MEIKDLTFKKVEAQDIKRMSEFYGLRPNRTCDSVVLESYLWKDYCNVRFAVAEDRALLWLMELNGEEYSAMPACKEEDLPRYFQMTEEYFNQVLNKPLVIGLADEEAVRFLNLDESRYEIREDEDLKDYLYDGAALRALSGKKLRKKKNHINGFMREYEGRYEYRPLVCCDRSDVWAFLDVWRENKGDETEEHLDYEVAGLHEVLKDCGYFHVSMAGVYIDGKLEAFTMGSYNPLEDMAVIHIEKANPEIRGLYQFINQQFLLHAYPEVKLVNREDDLGIEGLRKAKLSYEPIGYARKYAIRQKRRD